MMFPDGQQDAQVDPSPTDDQTQTNPESQDAVSSTAQDAQPTPSQQQDANEGAVPGALPPKDNLVGEIRRKILEDISPLIQGTVREALLGVQQTQQPKPAQDDTKYRGYTRSQWENVANHPNAQEDDRRMADRAIDWFEAQDAAYQRFQKSQEQVHAQSRDQMAFQGIINDYPEVFDRQGGRWNFSSPLFQAAMQIYNSEARLKSFGNEGIRVALDRAYSQMARAGQVQTTKKQVQLRSKESQLNKAQSGALSAGSLQVKTNGTPTPASQKQKIMEAYKANPNDPALRTAALAHLIPNSWKE